MLHHYTTMFCTYGAHFNASLAKKKDFSVYPLMGVENRRS